MVCSGWQENGAILNCGVSGTISGRYDVGGLVGLAQSGSVKACYARCSIAGYQRVGGLAGHCVSFVVEDSYSQSDIAPNGTVGGLIGLFEVGTITRCYSTGEIVGARGIISSDSDANVYNSFWDIEASGIVRDHISPLLGPYVSSLDMKKASTYSSNCWGGTTWTIDDANDYPRLAWENSEGRYIADPIVSFVGEGTELSPYEIADLNDLVLVASGSYFWDKWYILLNDIDLSQSDIRCIGYNEDNYFSGVFDGRTHTLSNLSLEKDQRYVGLFGYLGKAGRVQNLGLSNVDLRGWFYLGSVAGFNEGAIEDCAVSGQLYGRIAGVSLITNSLIMGGFVAENNGTISGCYFSGTLRCNKTAGAVGGFAGCNYGKIQDCLCSGTVSKGTRVSYSAPTGGFVARNYGVLDGCFADVDVEGNYDDVGGLVGVCSDGQITKCCSIGKVHGGGSNIGGLIGRMPKGRVYACYSTCDISGASGDYSGGLVGSNNGNILACYSTGCIIEGDNSDYSGGLVGKNSGTISQCYSSSFLWRDPSSWASWLGGLVGDNSGSVEYGYWDIQASGMTTSDGGDGLTTVQMHHQESFVGFDFDDSDGDGADWKMLTGREPTLSWEEYITVPDVVGLSEAEAVAVLGAAGLRWRIQSNYSDYPAGMVSWQRPDNPVQTGSFCPVVISVSKGQIFAGGEGTSLEPYQISTCQHLMQIDDDPDLLDKSYVLLNDIVFDPNNDANHVFTRPVITSDAYIEAAPQGVPFSGTFDGNYHKIVNLYVNTNYGDLLGLFGYIKGDLPNVSVVKNLTLESVQIRGNGSWGYKSYCGALVGYMRDAILENCHVRSFAVEGNEYIGGLAGYNFRGSIVSCSSSDGMVAGQKCTGGLLGRNQEGFVISSFSTASVSTYGRNGYSSHGGLVGYNYGENRSGRIERSHSSNEVLGGEDVGAIVGYSSIGTVSNCFSTSTVSGWSNVGGIAGFANFATISNCRMTGTVSGVPAGGIVGKNDGFVSHCYAASPISSTGGSSISLGGVVGGNGTNPQRSVDSSYWDVDVCGISRSAGGTGLPTDQMKQKASFEGWDFVGESANGTSDIWRMCVDDVTYPRLSWEYSINSDFTCPDGVNMIDFSILAQAWQSTPTDENWDSTCDLDGDEHIGAGDLAIACEQWMEGM